MNYKFNPLRPLYILGTIAIAMVIAVSITKVISIPVVVVVGVSTLFSLSIIGIFLHVVDSFNDENQNQEIIEENKTEIVEKPNNDLHFTQLAMDAIISPIIIIDDELKLIVANKAARVRFSTENLGARLETLIRSPEILNAVNDVKASNNPSNLVLEMHIPSRKYERVNISPFEFAAKRMIAISLLDETELRHAERMRADFLANAGHELRTPLASIRGFLETLQNVAKDDEKARVRFIAIMSSQAERMNRLINDILSLSRIELNEHVPPSEKADLTGVFEFALAASEPTAKNYSSKLIVEGLEKPLCAICDRDEISQVITNLIDNALKYGNPESEVKIHIAKDLSHTKAMYDGSEKWDNSASLSLCLPLVTQKKYLFVRVENLGAGIDRRNMPRLSERFYRIDEASNSKQGTGLGLAIVKHIINRHNGGLIVESVLGKCTSFSFFIPQE